MDQNKIGLFRILIQFIMVISMLLWNLNRFLNLDRFIFIPAFCTPHKKDKYQSMGNHRYQMILEATKNLILVKYQNELNKGLSYTIDTIDYFLEKYPKDSYFFLLDRFINSFRFMV